MRSFWGTGLAAGLLWAACQSASAYVEISGVFIPDDRCQALESIRRETNPGNVLTIPGQSYNVRALNREDGDYVQLDVPNATPRIRWVSIACGDLFSESEDTRPPQPDDRGETTSGFVPFFDTDNRPNDPSPPPPTLSAFDHAVLKVCGGWGTRPRATDFRAMLDDPALAADIDRIYNALNHSILGPPRNPSQFRNELTSIWFDQDGFRHIFCGESSGGTIGGLHFVGRYLQMQEEGWGGLDTRCNSTEIVPPVYTFGVRYRIARGGIRRACPKGYALNLNASEILIDATKALKLMLPRTSGKAMCLYKVEEPNERAYLAVFVIKSGAVRTFYPDASPTCDRNRPAENCLCAE